MEETIKNVVQWGEDRGLLPPENRFKQFIKTVEEVGELAQGLNKNNQDLIEDSIGDVMVTLILLAKQCHTDIETCLNKAYGEIKDRTGRTENGVFIKD